MDSSIAAMYKYLQSKPALCFFTALMHGAFLQYLSLSADLDATLISTTNSALMVLRCLEAIQYVCAVQYSAIQPLSGTPLEVKTIQDSYISAT